MIELEDDIPIPRELRPKGSQVHNWKGGHILGVKRREERYNKTGKKKLTPSYKMAALRRYVAYNLCVKVGDLPPIGSKAWLDTLQAFDDLKSLQRDIKETYT